MLKLFLQPFQPASIHSKVDRFFELYKLSLAFALCCAPWIILNFIVKLSLATSLLYGLMAMILIPNAIAMLRQMHQLYTGKHFSFKEDLAAFGRVWAHPEEQRWTFNLLLVALIMGFVGEFHLVMQAEPLRFMLIPFLIIGAFLLAAVWNYLLMVALDPVSPIKRQLSLAVWLSWRNLFVAGISGVLIALWFSVGYQIPSLNALLLNVVIFWAGYKLRYKAVAALVPAPEEVR